jgi:hypothetical protein
MRYKIMIQFILLAAGLMLLLNNCAPQIPRDVLLLSPEGLSQRQLQSRQFDTDEQTLLSASAALLQDLGFMIEESEPAYGLIFCSKHRDATRTEQVIGAVALGLLTGVVPPVDRDQWIRVSLVTQPIVVDAVVPSKCRTAVRVSFQRIVRNDRGLASRRESVVEPQMYREFFDKLAQSLFLEANAL